MASAGRGMMSRAMPGEDVEGVDVALVIAISHRYGNCITGVDDPTTKDLNPIRNHDCGAALWSATPAWDSKSGVGGGGREEDLQMSQCGFVPVRLLDAHNSASM